MMKISMPQAGGSYDIAILADGNYPSGEVALGVLCSARNVVCCDGAALEFIKRGGMPLAIVGDCDSLDEDMMRKFSPIIYRDTDQETNDLTKAVKFCVERGFGTAAILGATGKREDHTLGNISLLKYYASLFKKVCMITDHGVFDPIDTDTCFESFPNQQVSVFCLDNDTAVTTENLRYPLYGACLPEWWQGTLNSSLGDAFAIRTSGAAIVYRLFP